MDSLHAADRLALVNLSGPGHYLHWGIIQVSYANTIVILLMIAVFALALVVPFPGHGEATGSGSGSGSPDHFPTGQAGPQQ
jgi:hypothetical protein